MQQLADRGLVQPLGQRPGGCQGHLEAGALHETDRGQGKLGKAAGRADQAQVRGDLNIVGVQLDGGEAFTEQGR
ncbi:hypothetical protein D3C81_1981740 [compost metagenome]